MQENKKELYCEHCVVTVFSII